MYRSAWTRLNVTPVKIMQVCYITKFMEDVLLKLNLLQQEHVIELEEYASGLSLSES